MGKQTNKQINQQIKRSTEEIAQTNRTKLYIVSSYEKLKCLYLRVYELHES